MKYGLSQPIGAFSENALYFVLLIRLPDIKRTPQRWAAALA